VPTALLPSAPVLFIARAKTHPDLVAIQATRVGTKLNATLPATRVQRIGGSPPELWRDDPLLQVEAWAADEGTADLLIRTWVAALPDFRHRATTGEIHTYGIDSGPFWSPDDPTLSNNSRYIITVRLLTTV
jgi:hypothetical protein